MTESNCVQVPYNSYSCYNSESLTTRITFRAHIEFKDIRRLVSINKTEHLILDLPTFQNACDMSRFLKKRKPFEDTNPEIKTISIIVDGDQMYDVISNSKIEKTKKDLFKTVVDEKTEVKNRRKERLFKYEKGVTLVSSDGKEILISREEASKSKILRTLLMTNSEADEDTSGWDEKKLKDEPLLEIAIPLAIPYNKISSILESLKISDSLDFDLDEVE